MAPPEPPAVVRFGEFELDRQTRELQRNGHTIQLQPRVFELLAALLEHPGGVVTRKQLRARLWVNTFVEFDDNLNHAVRKLREILEDSPDHPRFVATLPRQGYRFVAPVEPVKPQAAASPPERAASLSFLSSRKWLGVALLLAMAGGTLAWHYGFRTRGRDQRVMLAVLPLDNLTGNQQRDYLSDALSDEIITELGRMNPGRLGVIARTSTLRYKHTTRTVAEIGRELEVDYVLEGSVRPNSPQLRVALQLIRVSDQTQMWAEAYDLSDTADMAGQRYAVAHIAHALAIEFAPEARRPASDAGHGMNPGQP